MKGPFTATLNIGSPFKIESEPYTLVAKKTVSTKPAAKVTSVAAKPAAQVVEPNMAVGETAPGTLAQTKNNLLPTVIVLSIVIGCVAVVTIGKKLT